jgi:pimeloyl-ACP methyl ester carboxylesterase
MLPEAPTAASFARRLVDLLDELGLERVPVVGNSMGGWTALELAKLGRASGALALCPAGMWEQSAPRYCRVSLGATRLLARASRPLRRQIAGSALGRTACFGQVCATPSRVAPATAVEAMHDVARAADFWRHWLHGNRGRFSGGDAITVPVTVIWGGRDRLLLARQARRIDELPPGAVVSTVPEWGHIPLWSDPDGTAATIARTFASSRGRSSPLEPVDG